MSQAKILPFDWFSKPDWSRLLHQSYEIMLLNDESLLGVDLQGMDKTTPTYLERYPEVLGSCVGDLVRMESEHVARLSSSTTLPVSVESFQTTLRKVVLCLGVIKVQLDQKISELGFRDYLTTNIIRRTGVEHVRPLLLLTEDDFKECMQGIMSDESFESIKAVLAKHGLTFSEE